MSEAAATSHLPSAIAGQPLPDLIRVQGRTKTFGQGASELVAVNDIERGLGMLMQTMNFKMDIGGSFSILILLAMLGLILNRTLLFVRRRVLFWEAPESGKLNKGTSAI